MIIHTNTALAARCPSCGQLSIHEFSLFDVGGGELKEIKCEECGAKKALLGKKPGGDFWVQIHCVMCDDSHFHVINLSDLIGSEVHFLYCDDTDLEICALGDPDDLEDFLDDLGDSDLEFTANDSPEVFLNSEVMYEVLSSLQDMAENGQLYCRRCGSAEISIDLHPDRVILTCSDCAHQESISAASDKDLEELINHKKAIWVSDELGALRRRRGK